MTSSAHKACVQVGTTKPNTCRKAASPIHSVAPVQYWVVVARWMLIHHAIIKGKGTALETHRSNTAPHSLMGTRTMKLTCHNTMQPPHSSLTGNLQTTDQITRGIPSIRVSLAPPASKDGMGAEKITEGTVDSSDTLVAKPAYARGVRRHDNKDDRRYESTQVSTI